MESWGRIMDKNERLSVEEDVVRRIWKDNFEDLYNMHAQEQIAVHIRGFHDGQRSNYFAEVSFSLLSVVVKNMCNISKQSPKSDNDSIDDGQHRASDRRNLSSGRKVVGAIRSLVKLGVCILSMQGCCMRHCSCCSF